MNTTSRCRERTVEATTKSPGGYTYLSKANYRNRVGMVPTSRQVYDSPPDERGGNTLCNPLWRASLSFGSDTITPSLAGIRFARSSVGKLTFHTPTMSPTIHPDDATTADETDTGERTGTRRRHRHPSNTAEKRRCADCRRDLVESLFPGNSAVCRDWATEEGGA